ncbi:MAG: rhomboid family intramembrane serine protease [Pirellulales bacterium]
MSSDRHALPLSQWTQISTFPWGTCMLVLATLLVGIVQHFDATGQTANLLGFHFSARPGRITDDGPLTAIMRSVTYVFPHGGWWHLIPNAAGLLVYGAIVEQRVGAWRLLELYLASGAIGILCRAFVLPLPTEPVAGASLAICGLLGAQLALTGAQRPESNTTRNARFLTGLAVVTAIFLWTACRAAPLAADRETSVLYHLLPLAAMWLIVAGLARC